MPLKVSQGVGAWVHHFVHSDNSRFKGKSVKQRQRMALGAFYSAKRAGKESLELEDALQELQAEFEVDIVNTKPTQKVIESKVHEAIFQLSEAGLMVYHVKVEYSTETGLRRTTSIDVRATSPEDAKSRALGLAREMDYGSVSVLDVAVVPGIPVPVTGPVNVQPGAAAGLVSPSDVSPTLSNAGVMLAKSA